MSWPDDGDPRFIIRESTGYVDGSEERTEILILDRAYCHRVVWSSFRARSMTRLPLHKQRAHAYLWQAVMEREECAAW